MKHGDGDEGLAIGLEEEADRVNAAEEQPDWDGLGMVVEELEAAQKAGELDPAKRQELFRRAKGMIPKGRDDLVEEYREQILETAPR